MPRTVAVTGATGFIGGHVVRRLRAAGWQVRVLTRRPATAFDTDVEHISGALDDLDSLRQLVAGAAAVVHAAGLVKARRRQDFFRVNAAGTAALAGAAAESAPGSRFVLLSSLAAREPTLSSYAASKRAAEAALAKTGARLSWTALRPPAVYGPGDREILVFFRAVRGGFAPVLGPPGQRFSMLHADDLAGAVVTLLAHRNLQGGVYEIDDCKPGGYDWDEVSATTAELLGRRPRRVQVPGLVLQTVAGVNALAGVFFARTAMISAGKVREIRHTDWVCHDRRLVHETGWRPRFSLRGGLAETLAWYKHQGWL